MPAPLTFRRGQVEDETVVSTINWDLNVTWNRRRRYSPRQSARATRIMKAVELASPQRLRKELFRRASGVGVT